MKEGLRNHWPEYLMEAAGLGLFMVSACFFGALLEHPGSPVRQAIADGTLRRVLGGLAMGATALGIFYSPWGRQSGAHINPAVTLTFLRLGKVKTPDAVFYTAAQFLGGLLGVIIAALVLGSVLADPAVSYVATVPGPAGAGAAFAAELIISFFMMLVVLSTASRPSLAPRTGLFAAALVATYISVEAPWSGMSMNPARTVASAAPSGIWTAAWIYFVAPVVGMQLAAQAFLTATRGRARHCAKLVHHGARRCIFCRDAAALSRSAA